MLYAWWCHQMETFRVTGHFWGASTPHKDQGRGALLFSSICARTNNRDAGDLRRHRAHYDITVMDSSPIEGWLRGTGCCWGLPSGQMGYSVFQGFRQHWCASGVSRTRLHGRNGHLWVQLPTRYRSNLVDKCGMQVRYPWWRHQMETLSALLTICVGNALVTGVFPAQRPVTRSLDVFFDLLLYKRLSKQWWGWWFEAPSRHYDVIVMKTM